MDNIPERQQRNEPRRGIAPFADGFETSNGGESIIEQAISGWWIRKRMGIAYWT